MTHRFDNCECAERKRGEGSFRPASDNHVSKIVADVTQRFAHGNGPAGTAIRVCCSDATKTKFNRDVSVSRTAEDLQGEGLIHAARSFFQEMRMLIFGIGYAAESGAETNADAMLRLFARIRKTGIFEGKLGRGDRKLSVTIEPL